MNQPFKLSFFFGILALLFISFALPASAVPLSMGSRGPAVSSLQQSLASDPTLYPEALITGYYGKATEAAVKRFQTKYNIVSSGTPTTTGYGAVGKITAAKIKEVFGASTTARPNAKSSVFPLPILSAPNPFLAPSSPTAPPFLKPLQTSPSAFYSSSRYLAQVGSAVTASPLSITIAINPNQYMLGDTLQGGGTVINPNQTAINASFKAELHQRSGPGDGMEIMKWSRDLGMLSIPSGTTNFTLTDIFGFTPTIPNDPAMVGTFVLKVMQTNIEPGRVPVFAQAEFNVHAQPTAQAPTLSQIIPPSGTIGTRVTLNGTSFTSTGNNINFAGVPNAIINIPSTDGKTIAFTVPATPCDQLKGAPCLKQVLKPGTYDVSVTNRNGTSNSVKFTVIESESGTSPLSRQIWFSPNQWNASQDYINLFKRPEEWPQARSKVKVFKFYGEPLDIYCPNPDSPCPLLSLALSKLKTWNIATAIEVRVENKERALRNIRTIQANGGQVTYLAMDEPLALGLQSQASIDQIADFVADFVRAIKNEYPGIQIGLVSQFNVEFNNYKTDTFITFITALEQRGVSLPFVHMDICTSDCGLDGNLTAQTLKKAQAFLNTRAIPMGIIYTTGLRNENSPSSEQGYFLRTLDFIRGIKTLFGLPQHHVFQSWAFDTQRNPVPRNLVPENNPSIYSHTRLINEGLAILYPQTVSAALSKTIFLSSATYTGNLGGLAGADAKCQALANAQPSLVGKTFKAWLSDSVTSAKDRLTRATVPYSMVSPPGGGVQTTIANNWNDLTDGTLAIPINRDEFGRSVSTSLFTWTNTNVQGGLSSKQKSCSNWTAGTNAVSGYIGDALSQRWPWTGGAPILNAARCSVPQRLYCVEQ